MRFHKWRLGLLLEALFVLQPLSAQTIKTLDLSSTNSTNKKFYVIFAARGGSATGHAFVMWGVEDSFRKRSTIRAFGLYPESDQNACRSAFGKIAGTIVDESTNHSIVDITDELIVQVDENYYDLSLKLAKGWECKHEFELLRRDCVEFVRAIGNSLYLEMPRRTILQMAPRAYIRALMASVTTATLTLPDAVYEGTLVNNKPVGRGTLTFEDESRIEGTFWGLDHVVGSGALTLASGYRYEGAIVNYRAHGEGKLMTATSAPILSGKFESGELKSLVRDYTPNRAYSKRRRTIGARVSEEFGLIELPRAQNKAAGESAHRRSVTVEGWHVRRIAPNASDRFQAVRRLCRVDSVIEIYRDDGGRIGPGLLRIGAFAGGLPVAFRLLPFHGEHPRFGHDVVDVVAIANDETGNAVAQGAGAR